MSEQKNPSNRTIRVSRSVANVMANSKPPRRAPVGPVLAVLVLVLLGAAAWHWRSSWLPGARDLAGRVQSGVAAPGAPGGEADAPASADADAADAADDDPDAAGPDALSAEPPASAIPAPAAIDIPSPAPLPEAAAAAPSAPPPPVRPGAAGAGSDDPATPAALFNAALRDYQTFLTDKAAHADLLPSIEERARRAAKGFEELLPVASAQQLPQINEALSQSYRLVSDCRRQRLERVRTDTSAPAHSPHAAFNRATVGPKRQAALPPAPSKAPDSP